MALQKKPFYLIAILKRNGLKKVHLCNLENWNYDDMRIL